jgi:hypothetical protein
VRYRIESDMLSGLTPEENRALHHALEMIERRIGGPSRSVTLSALEVVDGAAEVLEK